MRWHELQDGFSRCNASRSLVVSSLPPSLPSVSSRSGTPGGGGGGGENYRDAEEIAARAVESLVLSRVASGGIEAGYAAGAGSRKGGIQSGESGAGIGARPEGSDSTAEDDDGQPVAEKGYDALLAKGMSRQEIVQDLTRRVLRTLDEAAEFRDSRQGNNKGFA